MTESATTRHISRAGCPVCEPLRLPFQIWKCLSPALPHSSQVRLLLAGWVDETWSHSGRWWHWQEQPVTLSCLNRVEARAICGWRWRPGARGWWSSGLVRTNMSTYGRMIRCDVSPGHVDRTCRAVTWIHIPERAAVLNLNVHCLHTHICQNCTCQDFTCSLRIF